MQVKVYNQIKEYSFLGIIFERACMKSIYIAMLLSSSAVLVVALYALKGDYVIAAAQQPKTIPAPSAQAPESEFYQFKLPGADGSTIKLADFKGKVVLVVNVATQCNLAAKQYKELQKLYESYKDKGFEIIAVPSNDFGQELADLEERTCALADHVETSFLITDIVHVIDCKAYAACPLYKWLNERGHKAGMVGAVQWNFHKFLIGKNGAFIDWFAATTSPTAKKVKTAIEQALAA